MFAEEPPAGDEPPHVLADEVAADLDTAMVAGTLRWSPAEVTKRLRIVAAAEAALALGLQAEPVTLDLEQVAATVENVGAGERLAQREASGSGGIAVIWLHLASHAC